MALQKTIQHPTGATSSYWRVINVSLNYQDNNATVYMAGYINDQTRLDNLMPLDGRNYSIIGGDFTTYFSITELDKSTNPVEQAYIYIKTLPEFQGAIDV